MAKKTTMVRIRIGAEKGGARSVSVTRGKKTVTGSLEGTEAAQKKGLQRLIRAWCRTGVHVVMTVEGSKEVCTYCKEGTRYVCTKSSRTTVRRKPTAAKPGRKTTKPGRKPARKPAKPTAAKPGRRVSAYNKFVAAQRKAGKTMAQAAAAWRAHKAETGKTEVIAKPRRKPVSATAKTEVMAKPKARKAKAKKTAKPKATKAKATAKPKARKAKATKTTKKTGRKVSAYNKFVAAQRKAGKSMKEAAAAWRAQGGSATKATKAKAKKTTKAKATAKPKARKAKTTKAKTTKAKKPTKAKTTKASSAALPAVGDVVAAAALRSARRKHGATKPRAKRK